MSAVSLHNEDEVRRKDVRVGDPVLIERAGDVIPYLVKVIEDKRPLERYRDESKRLLGVLETRLDGRQWIMDDDYTIADISLVGWVRNLITFYEARDLVEYDKLVHVPAWLDRVLARPAVQRGLNIPSRG